MSDIFQEVYKSALCLSSDVSLLITEYAFDCNDCKEIDMKIRKRCKELGFCSWDVNINPHRSESLQVIYDLQTDICELSYLQSKGLCKYCNNYEEKIDNANVNYKQVVAFIAHRIRLSRLWNGETRNLSVMSHPITIPSDICSIYEGLDKLGIIARDKLINDDTFYMH